MGYRHYILPMNALVAMVSQILSTPIHFPFVHGVQARVNSLLEPGGDEYNKYIYEIRSIVHSSDFPEVFDRLRRECRLRISNIESRSIRSRCEIGLITADGYALVIHALLPDGEKITFGWFDNFGKK